MNKNGQVRTLLGMAAVIGGLDFIERGAGNQGYQNEARNPLFNADPERGEKIRAESRDKQAAKEARRASRLK